MGNNLHGLAQVYTFAFFLDNALIDTAGGHVVGARGLNIGKSLVMTQIEVGLVSVYGHIAFAMLVGVQRPGIDIDIRIKLLYGHAITASLEQASQ